MQIYQTQSQEYLQSRVLIEKEKKVRELQRPQEKLKVQITMQ